MGSSIHEEDLKGLMQRMGVMGETTGLLNMVGDLIALAEDSANPAYDQKEAELNERVWHMVKDHPESAGHVLVFLAVIIRQCTDPEEVQRWLDVQSMAIQQRLAQLGETEGTE